MCADRDGLVRLIRWVSAETSVVFSVFVTPLGESLILPQYRQAFVDMSHLPNVEKLVAQTNLSMPLDWLQSANTARIALWCTYHPSQVSRQTFLDQCQQLAALKIRYSVGMVGVKDNFNEIVAMRSQMPPNVYLWINSERRIENYYTDDDIRLLASVDPLFTGNVSDHLSRGKLCRAGDTVIAVDHIGNIQRCSFVPQIFGNIDDPNWRSVLQLRPCPNEVCNCYIGYVHICELNMDAVFGDGILERIPVQSSKSQNEPDGSQNGSVQ
jgi:hypothetical protein